MTAKGFVTARNYRLHSILQRYAHCTWLCHLNSGSVNVFFLLAHDSWRWLLLILCSGWNVTSEHLRITVAWNSAAWSAPHLAVRTDWDQLNCRVCLTSRELQRPVLICICGVALLGAALVISLCCRCLNSRFELHLCPYQHIATHAVTTLALSWVTGPHIV